MQVNNEMLKEKVQWVWRETLKLHGMAPGTRIASSLSPIEILVVLYYGGIMKVTPKDIYSESRDRFIISKAHGSISFYPILADFGYFESSELSRICQEGSFLGSIPDPTVPGYETMNGSLGHGLGVGCGMAIGLRTKKSENLVFVLQGDGELHEGSVWEAIMFASEHRLDNLILIIDYNKACMLDYCKNIINLEPIEEKFKVFGWDVRSVDGHNTLKLYETLSALKGKRNGKPKAVIAHTIKGRGVSRLETDPLCHIRSLSRKEVDALIGEAK